MYYKQLFDINTFEFWGGAKTKVAHATAEQRAMVTEAIEEEFKDYIPTSTDINDFVWNECDDIFNETI